MYLPILFVLASSSLVSIFIWIGIMVFFAVVELIKNAGKTKSKVNRIPLSDSQEHVSPYSKNGNRKTHVSSRPTHTDYYSVVGHDEDVFASVDEPEPSNDIVEADQKKSPKIQLDSPDEIKKAIIYHEILDPKF